MAAIPIKDISVKSSEICEKHGAYLYDITFVKEGPKKVLRIFADKDGGIGIDLCEKISRDISDYLDETNAIDTVYSLEVSSPGAERKLKTEAHYKAVLGKKICITLYSAVDGAKSFTGVLTDFCDNAVTIECEKTTQTFDIKQIADAHLYFDINEFLRSQNN